MAGRASASKIANLEWKDLMSTDGNAPHKSKPIFDPTINYGHVFTVASFILAGAGAYYGMRAELQSVDQRVAKIENTLQQLANVLVLTARQDERLIAIERRVDRLEQPMGHR
jgi:hypothetical protein